MVGHNDEKENKASYHDANFRKRLAKGNAKQTKRGNIGFPAIGLKLAMDKPCSVVYLVITSTMLPLLLLSSTSALVISKSDNLRRNEVQQEY